MVHRTGQFKCPDCTKSFSRLEYVERHRRLKHLNIRPWSCKCGVSYARSDLLSRHRRKCRASPTATTTSHPVSHTSQHQHSFIHHQTNHLLQQHHSLPSHHSFDPHPPSYEQAISSSNQLHHPSKNNPNLRAKTFETQQPLDQLLLNLSPDLSPCNHLQSTGKTYQQVLYQDVPQQSYLTHSQPQLYVACQGPQIQLSSSSSSVLPETTRDDGTDDDCIDHQQLHRDPIDPEYILGSPTSEMVRYSHPQFFITDEPESSPFYLNPTLWILAFLCQRAQGFTIPRIGDLSKFVRKATSIMLPMIPMIHLPTFKTSMISIHLGYALSVAGAAADPSQQAIAFTEQSLSYKRPLVQKDFINNKNTFDFRFELLQTLLTYQFLGIFNRLDFQKRKAVAFGPTMIENLKELDLANVVRNAPDYVQLVLSGKLPLEIGWRSWSKYEMHKRTLFLVAVLSFQVSRHTELILEDLDVRLPCHESMWMAPTAEEWLKAALKYNYSNQTGYVGEDSIPSLSQGLQSLSIQENRSDREHHIQQHHKNSVVGFYGSCEVERFGGELVSCKRIEEDYGMMSESSSKSCSHMVCDEGRTYHGIESYDKLGRFAKTVLAHCQSKF
ncbi:hypothetical protein PPACK8108_LOCUS15212 [Phakopsora pachyrhizi]|uniref:C2H2-type domain-containing protein n=1 Tax=Phakopsora pachyrhizi TaxID=170000 RepID=A0AAV0B876_PHAPC|nr:hypothetical protein PPACK8108_LOCUS15212 [Phakopsora pachyrhizi]